MAARTLTTQSDVLLTAIGGAITADDTVTLHKFSVTYTAGDLTASASVEIASVHLTAGFQGLLTGSAALKVAANPSGGTGFVRNECSSTKLDVISTSSTGVVDQYFGNPQRADHQCLLDTMLLEDAYCHRGLHIFGPNCDVDDIFGYGGTGLILQTASAATFPLDSVTIYGGEWTLSRDTAAIDVRGGKLTINTTDVTPSSTVNLSGTGVLEVIESGAWANGGTLASGLIDATKLRAGFTATSFTRHEGVTIRYSNSNAARITFASATDIGNGPKFEYVP